MTPEVAELQAAQIAAGEAHAEQVSSPDMWGALSILQLAPNSMEGRKALD